MMEHLPLAAHEKAALVAESDESIPMARRASAGAKQGARSVRALEVFGGDDIDSDGDEAPRAEEELAAAGEAAADPAVREVKAEPTPALEPAIKREPSENRQQQQQQHQPTCVRSAKRRAVWARGGAGCAKAEEATS
jgi:hypothetical protein